MADESFCEVCGDTGGALSMVICENTDLGCLGGIHLYCCLPLRTEAPTEAWYCSQCTHAREEAAKAQQAVRLARKRQRQERQRQRRRQHQLELQERQGQLGKGAKRQQPEQEGQSAAPAAAQPPGKAQETGEGGRQQDGTAQGQRPPDDRGDADGTAASSGTAAAAGMAAAGAAAAAASAPAAMAPAAGRQQGGAAPRQPSGLVAAIAMLGSGRGAAPPQAAGRRPPAAAGGAASQQHAQQPPSAAARDTLAVLFASMDRQDEAGREQRRRVSSLVDGTSRLMERSMGEREARQRALQRQLSLAACQSTRLHWRGQLQLPLPQEAALWGAKLLCYGLPGNPHSADAARWLVPLADAAAGGRQPQPQLVDMADLGIAQEQAHLGASLLLAPDESEPAQQAAQRPRWSALWHALCSSNQAVAITVPPGAAMAALIASARSSGGLPDGQLEGLFLALVPNRFDPDSQALFGLLAVPHKTALPPKEAAPARGILRRASSFAAAPTTAAAAAASAPATAAAGTATTDAAAAAAAAADEQLDSSGGAQVPPARPAQAAAAAAGVGWPDGSRDDAPKAASLAQLELREGAHYAAPHTRDQQAARPPRLRASRAVEAVPSGPLPLEGLHIAVVGFTVDMGWMPDFLRELRELGATVYTSKVVMADVLVLHPGALQGGLDARYAGTFPLGLAHLLATSPVRAYSDSSLRVLHDMKGLRRRLQGEEWELPTLVFPGGLLVLLDAAALCSMPTAELSEVLSQVQRLQAAAQDARYMWGVAAAPADLAALQAAAERGHGPAAGNWQLWQGSSVARQLTPGELSSGAGRDAVPPSVAHASKAARVHAASCRLIYLCSSHQDTLRQAEGRVSILSGNPVDLLDFLRERK